MSTSRSYCDGAAASISVIACAESLGTSEHLGMRTALPAAAATCCRETCAVRKFELASERRHGEAVDPSRRSLLIGGVGVAALAGCGGSKARTDQTSSDRRQYAWAINSKGLLVPPSAWTKMRYDQTLLNTTTAHLILPDRTTWVFPTASASGIWQVLLNVAWDNAVSPTGQRIAPRTHRKLVRFVQQNLADPQLDQAVIPGASSDLTFHSDLNDLDDQDRLTDGSKGYQQQQTNIQLGVRADGPDQRCWFEVYQNSGQPLMCRFDGSRVPRSGSRPPLTGIQAPSIMIAKMCDF